jgi:transcription initiation factor TFIIIB Brf1 subunit/transcription initiation factor TFIIB
MSKCKLCFSDNFVESDNDVVCQKCGTVAGMVQNNYTAAPKSTVSLTGESKLGSRNIMDNSLSLTHLNKQFTSKMLNSTDVYLEYFSRVCDDLHMPRNMARHAFHLFKKLRHAKLSLGRTAVFCIVHTYTISDIVYNGEQIIKTVQSRFKLKRKITISQSLYRIKPTAIEMKLVENVSDSKLLTLKKNIHPENYHKAVKITNSFSGNHTLQTKSAQEFLEAYGYPTMISRGKNK